MSDHEPIPDFATWQWRGRVAILCFDYDAVTKPQVRQALKRLGNYLKTLGAKVRIKLLPSPNGKNVGADDYIARYGIEKFKALDNVRLSDPRFADWEAHAVVQELNKTLAFVMHDGRATVLSVREDPEYPGTDKISLSRVSDIKLEYANQYYEYKDGRGNVIRKPKFERWLNDPLRRVVRRITLIPGAAPGFDPATKDWNLWQGWAVVAHQTDETHSWKKLKSHIKRAIANGDSDHAEYITSWLAYCVQHPDRRPEVALVLMGGEGAGKGILLNAVMTLFGRHGLHLMSQRQLVGNFNDHLKDALFIFADEAFFAGDKASIGTLKATITEPTLLIEPKFVNAYTLPNYRKIAIASNEAWVVPADTDARRFAVFRVSDAYKGRLDYFKAIGNELAHGGYEAMLWELQHRNLSRFDARNIPQTNALLDQKKLSWDEITGWWFERLCLGRIRDADTTWVNVVSRDSVRDVIEKRITSQYEGRALETKIGQTLKKLCPAVRAQRRTIAESQVAGVRRRWVHIFPKLKDCRAAFERAVRMRINWKTGELDTGDES
jgi:hypothetical protein